MSDAITEGRTLAAFGVILVLVVGWLFSLLARGQQVNDEKRDANILYMHGELTKVRADISSLAERIARIEGVEGGEDE